MDATAFDTALETTLRDVPGATWSQSDRQTATRKAVMRYSRYRPAMRRYGTGNLWTAASSSGNTIEVIGGVWFLNDVVLIDPLSGPSAEAPLTVIGIAAVSSDPTFTSPVLQLTLSGTLAHNHLANALIVKQPPTGATSAGLTIVAGTDTYLLPTDFIRPEQESFDLAVQAKATVSRALSFYDAVYACSNALSQVGWGSGSNFAGTYLAGGSTDQQFFPALTNGQPLAGQAGGGQMVYRFLLNQPQMLVITPVPQIGQVLDFFYKAMHTLYSLPESDSDAVLAAATAEALLMQAIPYALDGEEKTSDFDTRSSKSVQGFTSLAKTFMDTFERRIVRRPYITTG